MQKVVLISQQGSGTNLLRSFLGSHKDIYFGDELFLTRRDKTGIYQNSDDRIEVFLDKFFNKRKEDVVGFDLKYNQINNEILNYIEKNNFLVIHLIKDVGRTFLKNITQPGQVMTYEEMISYAERVGGLIKQYRHKYKGKKYLEITYEDMTRGYEINQLPEDFERKVQKFLGVKYNKLKITDVGKALDKRF